MKTPQIYRVQACFAKKENHALNFSALWMKRALSNPRLGEGSRFSYKRLRKKETISWRNGSMFLYKGLLAGYDNFSKPQTKYHSMLICSFPAGNLRRPVTLQHVHSCLVWRLWQAQGAVQALPPAYQPCVFASTLFRAPDFTSDSVSSRSLHNIP